MCLLRSRFHRKCTSSTQSVHVVKSWDKFTKQHQIELDLRKTPRQWLRCYVFEDISCDGDSCPNGTGGIKIVSTDCAYELDNGTEIFDTSIPSATSCPHMPDQPGNVVWAPVEVQPPRSRSASMSSMINGGTKALSPADELETPRPLSTTSKLTRLNTSLSALERSARSRLRRSIRYPRSPVKSFGPKSPATSGIEQTAGDCGRLHPLDRKVKHDANISHSGPQRGAKFVPRTRDVSPQLVRESHSREPPPLRQSIAQESSSHHRTALDIPDEMAEEEIEDDYNFATQLRRLSVVDNGFPTALSPPSASSQRAPHVRQRTATDTSKPLPRLPGGFPPSLMPSPLCLQNSISVDQLPRSHFSTLTLSRALTSRTDSHFNEAFSPPPSIYDLNNDDDLEVETGSSGYPIVHRRALF